MVLGSALRQMIQIQKGKLGGKEEGTEGGRKKEGSLMMLCPISLCFLSLNEISLSVQLFSLKPGRKYLLPIFDLCNIGTKYFQGFWERLCLHPGLLGETISLNISLKSTRETSFSAGPRETKWRQAGSAVGITGKIFYWFC